MSDSENIPYGFCQCGCGRKAPIATKTRTRTGLVKGRPARFVHGHHRASTAEEQVAERVPTRTPGECWNWTGPLSAYGYGIISVGVNPRRAIGAHRYMYEKANGPIPEKFDVHHMCENRSCVNPEHLVAVSRAAHMREHMSDSCRRGHPWTPENTYVRPSGARNCRTCREIRRAKALAG